MSAFATGSTWNKASPKQSVEKTRIPVMLIHGLGVAASRHFTLTKSERIIL